MDVLLASYFVTRMIWLMLMVNFVVVVVLFVLVVLVSCCYFLTLSTGSDSDRTQRLSNDKNSIR